MSSAAQREQDVTVEPAVLSATGTDSTSGLRELVAERLAAHRNRRAEAAAQEEEFLAQAQARRSENRRGASKVRDAVAARYQSSLSYEEYLAVEAERALQQANAEAEIAARNAAAIAEARARLIEEIERRSEIEEQSRADEAARHVASRQWEPEPSEEPSLLNIMEASERPVGLRVQHFGELGPVKQPEPRQRWSTEEISSEELQQLEQEIEFRVSPEFGDHQLEMLPIAPNIIEFPRPLVASRKARPRLAEGPLREDYEPEPQLRIFEVESEQIEHTAEVAEPAMAPEWQSLQLGAEKAPAPVLPLDAQIDLTLPPEAAPLELRLMAFAMDGCCIAAAVLGFSAVVAALAAPQMHNLPLPLLGATLAAVLFLIFLLYQLLFFSLNEATPGMRYARIGLCTFSDSYPSRKAMRRRIVAQLLAACPLGLGLLWALLDDDRLGWHDRISRMYPRAY